MTNDLALAANANDTPSREFLERQAFEAFKAFALAFQRLIESPNAPVQVGPSSTTKDVMTADEVAEFLGVDRNTVYRLRRPGRHPAPATREAPAVPSRGGRRVARHVALHGNHERVMQIFAACLVERSRCAVLAEALSSWPCSKRSSKGNSR